jgi:hypothetical protein
VNKAVRTYARDNLWLCPDCHGAAVGDDETIVDQGQAQATEDGLTRLAETGEVTPDYNLDGEGEEYSDRACACCNPGVRSLRTRVMRRFAILNLRSQEILDSW